MFMKKVKATLALLTAAFIVSGIFFVVSAAEMRSIEVGNRQVNIIIDGEQASGTESFIYNNSTYVPFRFIAEALGAEVDWDADSFSVIIRKPKPVTATTTAATLTTSSSVTTSAASGGSSTTSDTDTSGMTTSKANTSGSSTTSAGGYAPALPPGGSYNYNYSDPSSNTTTAASEPADEE
jgi:hypothetical protein